MTDLLKELRRRKRTSAEAPKMNPPEYFEKKRATMARARAAREASIVRDQLRAYEFGDATDAVCFLCGITISDDEIAVTTALGPVHQHCQDADEDDE
jgi:hypothetical protein